MTGALRQFLFGAVLINLMNYPASAADWQWSVPMGNGRAFLWIPPKCRQVRAVVVGQHNMIEEGIFEHPTMRKTLADLNVAEVWVAPPFDGVFRFDQDAGGRFDDMMQRLAAESGYQELEFAPVVPMGHSACASFPWNFAAWNPGRTLAVLSVHGDAPLTPMTGSGQPNPDWGARNLDGVPGLMVMAEYEWVEGRLLPALEFRNQHPRTPLAMLAEPGRGHFDYSDNLVKFLAMFVRKAAEQRLPADMPLDKPPVLKPINPAKGWLVERWHLNQPRTIKPTPISKYNGDPKEAFWCFDREMAMATQNYFADQPGKLPQLLGFVQDGGIVPQTDTHQQVTLKFEPMADGVTFRLQTTFLDQVESGSKNLSRWTYLPAGSPLGHATGGGPIVLSRITGPVVQPGAETFAVRFNRASIPSDRRLGDIWLLASHPGDAKYKSAVQQALLKIPFRLGEGAEQRINFPEIPDQKRATRSLRLHATSDANVPVYYYVREGPAEMDGDVLKFTTIPPRAKFPVKITVVAWQWGRTVEPKLKSAEPVERTFGILP